MFKTAPRIRTAENLQAFKSIDQEGHSSNFH